MAESRLQSHEGVPPARDVLAAAAVMVGTLLAALPDDRREWLDGVVARQGQAFPGAEALQSASEAILQEVDQPLSLVGSMPVQPAGGADRMLDAAAAENKRLADALAFYADERNWLNDRELRGVPGYHGREIARRALDEGNFT